MVRESSADRPSQAVRDELLTLAARSPRWFVRSRLTEPREQEAIALVGQLAEEACMPRSSGP